MKKFLAFLGVTAAVIVAGEHARADIMGNSISCSGNMHRTWGIPDGIGISCDVTLSKDAMNFILSRGGAIVACNPLADAAIAAGGGPEDPFADALAGAIQITCPAAIQQVVRQYNTCNSLPINLSAHAAIGGAGSSVNSRGC